MVDVDVQWPVMHIALPDPSSVVSLVDRALENPTLAKEFAADVYVTTVSTNGEGCEQAALDQQVRFVSKDIAILAGPRLALVGVHDEVTRQSVIIWWHKGPLQAGGKAGPAASAQTRSLNFLADPVPTLLG